MCWEGLFLRMCTHTFWMIVLNNQVFHSYTLYRCIWLCFSGFLIFSMGEDYSAESVRRSHAIVPLSGSVPTEAEAVLSSDTLLGCLPWGVTGVATPLLYWLLPSVWLESPTVVVASERFCLIPQPLPSFTHSLPILPTAWVDCPLPLLQVDSAGPHWIGLTVLPRIVGFPILHIIKKTSILHQVSICRNIVVGIKLISVVYYIEQV